jgi:hypothetical protein
MSDDKDEKGGMLGLMTVVVKYVLGPVVAAVLAWGFAADRADKKHEQSARGYETLAGALNPVLVQLTELERRIDALERAPATQPIRVVLPGYSEPGVRMPIRPRPPTKAPVAVKAPAHSPERDPFVEPSRPKPAPAAAVRRAPVKQIPSRLGDLK